eukprot:1141403-Pelagomonas_calceolata.AAC.4
MLFVLLWVNKVFTDLMKREGRRWHFLNPGISSCIVLGVEWSPILRSFQSTSGTAEARPCSQAGEALWQHLRRISMPTSLLPVIQDLYTDDEYVFKDGAKTARVHPTRVVKQVN